MLIFIKMIRFLFLLKIPKLSWSKFKEKFSESGSAKVYAYYRIKKKLQKNKNSKWWILWRCSILEARAYDHHGELEFNNKGRLLDGHPISCQLPKTLESLWSRKWSVDVDFSLILPVYGHWRHVAGRDYSQGGC